MSFSKDAETGVYLACNKAFAAYAQKTHPNEVVGLTDGQIFDAETARAQSEANIDALTGIKNKHAYMEAEKQLNGQIRAHQQPDFAVIILDINNLKTVNDTEGHHAGDRLIREACGIICNIFKHSPMFRIGGGFIDADGFHRSLPKRQRRLRRRFSLCSRSAAFRAAPRFQRISSVG